MTLPATGTMTMDMIRAEIGLPVGTRVSFTDSSVYALAGKTAGVAISLNDFYGKTVGSTPGTSFFVSTTPSPAVATRSTNTSGNVVVGSTATASGGTGTGFTYAWTYVSGDSFTIGNAGFAAATFTKFCAPGDVFNGTYLCTATDSGAHTATTNLSVNLNGFGL